MFLKGIIWIILFQILGDVVSGLINYYIPGSILGFIFLLIYLFIRQAVSKEIEKASKGLLLYLPMFLIPTSVGVIVYFSELINNTFAFIFTILGSVILSFIFCVSFIYLIFNHKLSQKKK